MSLLHCDDVAYMALRVLSKPCKRCARKMACHFMNAVPTGSDVSLSGFSPVVGAVWRLGLAAIRIEKMDNVRCARIVLRCVDLQGRWCNVETTSEDGVRSGHRL